MLKKTVQKTEPLGFSWPTNDPFLFCVHHNDFYPKANENMGPDASLSGRDIGQDFTVKDGWRMYHGAEIPGFPEHPHRGFETITVVLNGYIDHSDSFGAAGRYGCGDVQWMTAGSGLQHAEMFPLLNRNGDNPLELFQIWLNLPAQNKMCEPYYKMLWSEDVPVYTEKDKNGNTTEVTVIAGEINHTRAPDPAPDSWAADPKNDVGVWLIHLSPNARFELPAASVADQRSVYFYKGSSIKVEGEAVSFYHRLTLSADQPTLVENGSEDAYLLLLQGKSISEPVAQHGPFVMNSGEEIQAAIADYRRTQFGGWPWPRRDNVHPRDTGRFARYADGREEKRD